MAVVVNSRAVFDQKDLRALVGYSKKVFNLIGKISISDKIQKEGFPPLGFHVLLGADFQAMAQNQGRNLQEGRIVLAQVVARK